MTLAKMLEKHKLIAVPEADYSAMILLLARLAVKFDLPIDDDNLHVVVETITDILCLDRTLKMEGEE